VSHHAKKLERRRRGSRPTYNWEEVQAYDDAGHGLTACIERFGFSRAAWGKAIQRGQIRPRARGRPFDDLLTIERRTQRTHLKMRLLRAGLLRAECFECGLTEWRGRPLSLELDHVNGTKLDTRLENLRLLCPNCHSQTETYAGRNKRSSGHRLRDLRGCYYVNCGASAVAAKKENSLGGG
jgi:5-methylcytosine-specific restriction endonuclease McrA